MKKQANLLIKLLKEKNLTIALAESVTGGLAAHKLASVQGTSHIFKGSVVCYTPEVKHGLLSIPQTIISKYTCESSEVTAKMAAGLKKLVEADIYAAITGLASPGGSENKLKPVGTVFIAVIIKGNTYNLIKLFRGSPLQVKLKACNALFSFIMSKIK